MKYYQSTSKNIFRKDATVFHHEFVSNKHKNKYTSLYRCHMDGMYYLCIYYYVYIIFAGIYH